MLKIAILEDETEQSEQMLQFLKRYQLTHLDFMYEAQVFTTGTALLTCLCIRLRSAFFWISGCRT